MRDRRSRLGSLAIYVLVGFAALALPLEASEPIHVHHGEVLALFNGECPLATLAAFNGVAPLPSAPASISHELAPGPAMSLGAESPRTALVCHTDPRAPPAA